MVGAQQVQRDVPMVEDRGCLSPPSHPRHHLCFLEPGAAAGSRSLPQRPAEPLPLQSRFNYHWW